MTQRIRLILAIVVAGSVAAALVAGAAARPSEQVVARSNTVVVPGVAADSAPSGTASTVTLADDTGTIHIAVGDTFLLMLGTDYNWDVSVSDTSILSRVPDIPVVRGAQGIYQANAPGTVTLTATGSLACAPGVPCPLLARLFRVTIVVQ